MNLNYGEDDQDIELVVPLHFVWMYSTDVATLVEDEKKQYLIAQGASQAATATAVPLQGENGSAVEGKVDLTYVADVDNVRLQVGWKAEDKWTFETDSDNAGVFQSFFRDQLGATLPFKLDGTETINDNLAV